MSSTEESTLGGCGEEMSSYELRAADDMEAVPAVSSCVTDPSVIES